MKILKTKKLLGIALVIVFVIVYKLAKTQYYYSGYVVDESKHPISDVLVREYKGKRSTVTDKNGHFKFNRDKGNERHLIFEKEGYLTDTVFVFTLVSEDEVRYNPRILGGKEKVVLRKVRSQDEEPHSWESAFINNVF